VQLAKLQKILDAILLSADKPLSIEQLFNFFSEEDRIDRKVIRNALKNLQKCNEDRGFELTLIASGYRYQTREAYKHWVSKHWDERPPRYSRALLETLALIVYRQPTTRAEIEDIRGVAVSSTIIKTLLEREWVRVVGHKDVPGRPAMYGSTRQFLDYFNLDSLDQMPNLNEIQDIEKLYPELDLKLPKEEKKKMAKLEALIFDVDGTLADTERDGHRVAFNQAFAEAGLNWDWTVELYGELLSVTGGKERIRLYIEKYLEDFDVGDDIQAFSATLHQRKTHFYLELLKTGAIPLRAGVETLINEARAAGLRLAIATTTTPANVTYLLTATLGEESNDWFEVIAAGDIVPAKKPAPDIYTWAMEQMDISAEVCMAFEDSLNGVKSSLAANLKTLITVNGYTKNDDFSGAAIVLDQMGTPEKGFKVLEGDAGEHRYVNLAMINALHEQ
jgi:segregation and condensation protein B